jgi:signal peptidase I
MSPNVNNGDYLFAHKFAYNSQNPARGDVIIIKINNLSYIKRVAGLPGDRIQLKDSILYINDLAVPRKRIEDYSIQDAHGKHVVHQFIETLPEGREYNILVDSNNALHWKIIL